MDRPSRKTLRVSNLICSATRIPKNRLIQAHMMEYSDKPPQPKYSKHSRSKCYSTALPDYSYKSRSQNSKDKQSQSKQSKTPCKIYSIVSSSNVFLLFLLFLNIHILACNLDQIGIIFPYPQYGRANLQAKDTVGQDLGQLLCLPALFDPLAHLASLF